MSKFTGGKWTADDYGCYVFAHGTDMMICQMRGEGYLRSKEGLSDEEIMAVQEANARLIAAAPEMYELLRIFTDEPSETEKRIYELCSAFLKAQELLARIDGEEAEE